MPPACSPMPWQAIEGLKNAGAPGLRDAGPAIANHDNRFRRAACRRDLDRAFAAMAPCVFEQVAEEPVQEPDIALDENGLARNHGEVRVEGSAFLGKQPDKVDPLQRRASPASASRRLASRISSTSPSSSAIFRAISSRCSLGAAPPIASAAILSRASGERSSWEALASSRFCAFTSASIRSADALKVRASLPTSSRPRTATRALRSPRPNAATPFCNCSRFLVSRRTTGYAPIATARAIAKTRASQRKGKQEAVSRRRRGGDQQPPVIEVDRESAMRVPVNALDFS